MLIDGGRLEREYFERRPDVEEVSQLVSFGTSGIVVRRCAADSPKLTPREIVSNALSGSDLGVIAMRGRA